MIKKRPTDLHSQNMPLHLSISLHSEYRLNSTSNASNCFYPFSVHINKVLTVPFKLYY